VIVGACLLCTYQVGRLTFVHPDTQYVLLA
jgi:hypothetical protein